MNEYTVRSAVVKSTILSYKQKRHNIKQVNPRNNSGKEGNKR